MDRSLATLLRSLQASSNSHDAARLLPSATSLLARLSNPLNVSLLASQLLSYQTLYPLPIDLISCRRIFSAFYTAALRFVEAEVKDDLQSPRSNLSRTAWTKAVIQGADEKSPRWRHTLLIGGLLLGFEGQGQSNIPGDLRKKLEAALVTACNLALVEQDGNDPNSQLCVVWVLNVTFMHLSDYHRSQLNYDLLLPQLIDATFFSREGLEHGYWVGIVDTDIRQVPGNKFNWSLKSPSGIRIQEIRSRNLTSALGPLARLIAHSMEHVRDSRQILAAIERIAEFSRNLALSWRQNKLSEVDLSEERDFLDAETIETSMPVLLHILRDTLFAVVICLRSAVGRLLTESSLATKQQAPALATSCLHILRDTYFIAHRFGQTSSSQYAFVNFTAIDVLNQYPQQAEAFLISIRPSEDGKIPVHPLERLYDLYFLNLAEHFTLSLTPAGNESLLLSAAMVYITADGDKRLNEIYEAAHSVLLAVLGAPQNSEICSRHIPFYVDILMRSFPSTLTPRQFRLAIKSVVQIAGPPSAMSVTMPYMQPTVLEMLRERGLYSSEDLLPASDSALSSAPAMSERSVLLLASIDCLPFLAPSVLGEWLPVVAEQLHKITNPAQRSLCQTQLWNVLSNGEMDVERAAVCVTWWTSRGGKELVLYGEMPDEEDYVMSGAVQESHL